VHGIARSQSSPIRSARVGRCGVALVAIHCGTAKQIRLMWYVVGRLTHRTASQRAFGQVRTAMASFAGRRCHFCMVHRGRGKTTRIY
jgi:hypothetical protein